MAVALPLAQRPRIAALLIRLRRLVSSALRGKAPVSGGMFGIPAYWPTGAFFSLGLTFLWFQVSKQKALRFFDVSS